MSDKPAETRALANRIMGLPNRPTAIDVIEAVASQAPEADDERGLPAAGHTEGLEGLEGLTSGAPDTAEPHNPWGRD